MADKLAVFSSSPSKQLSHDRLGCDMIYLYRSYILDNEKSWKMFENDEDICCFHAKSGEEMLTSFRVINLKNNVYTKVILSLKHMFSSTEMPKDQNCKP